MDPSGEFVRKLMYIFHGICWEYEDKENENEPDKNSFFNVYFRERLVID